MNFEPNHESDESMEPIFELELHPLTGVLSDQKDAILSDLSLVTGVEDVKVEDQMFLDDIEAGFEDYCSEGLRFQFRVKEQTYSGYIGLMDEDGVTTLKLKIFSHGQRVAAEFEETIPLESPEQAPEMLLELFERFFRGREK